MNTQQVAIIGGGIAGMVAASKLQRTNPGIEITLYERSKNLGGRASTVRKDAFYLNQGAHALYNSGTLNKYLRQLGISMAGSAPPLGNSLAYLGGKFMQLPTGLLSYLSTPLLTATEKIALTWFLRELLNLDTSKLLNVPFSSWLEKRFGRSNLAKLIQAMTRLGTYSNSPSVLSAGMALEQLKIAQDGVTYLDYGWQKIIEELRSSLSGPITERTDHAVLSLREVITEYGPRVAVVTNDRTEFFDYAILAVPPHVVEQIAPGVLPAGFSQTLENAKMACFDICLKKLPNPQNTFALGLDEPLYYSVHGAAAKLADNDGILIHMGYYLKGDEQGSEHHLNLMMEMLDKLQPGWRDEVAYKRFLPNMVASYSMPMATQNGVGGLPTPELPGSKLIFAAGDWVGHNGHFLADASAASALEAARIVSTKLSQTAACICAA